MNSDRRESVPDVASVTENERIYEVGMRSGHASGIAQRRKNMERKTGIDMVCHNTASVCRRRCTGTFRGPIGYCAEVVQSANYIVEGTLVQTCSRRTREYTCRCGMSTYADRSQPAPARRPLARWDFLSCFLLICVVFALRFSRRAVSRSCSRLFSWLSLGFTLVRRSPLSLINFS